MKHIKMTVNFPIIYNLGCISFKVSKEIAIITTTINAHKYIRIQDNFLISSIENLFDDEVIFQYDDASY